MTTPGDTSEDCEGRPDLVALIRSELSTTDALAAGDHLATCATCRLELVELVVGASLLRRAAAVASPAAPATPPTSELPALDLRSARRRPARRRLALVAAAALVVGGLGGAVTVARIDGEPDPDVTVAAPDRVVPLDAVAPTGSGSAPAGEVHMVADGGGTTMTILTSDLPQAAADEFYEAWLLDPATNKMLPLGVVSTTESTFRVDDALLGSYDAIDLSLESDDGDPHHSVTSVLRGSYADETNG